jgi:hypothetical protein
MEENNVERKIGVVPRCATSTRPSSERGSVASHYATLHMKPVMLSLTLRMEIEAIAVALHGEDDAWDGG